MSEKDIEDLRWGLHLTCDFIALSFVRSAKDVDDVRKVMHEEGVLLPVIAKIEKPQAIENLDEIIKAFDGFMVARGDLGVECPLEDVPFLQKRVIDKARRNAKPVIVATQMLESMISNPAPTRAEASDVANAVLDGADAVMLSGETSVGDYPIETVRTMSRIITSTENHELNEHGRHRLAAEDPRWCDREGRCRGRRPGGCEVPRGIHPERRLRTPAGPLPRQDPGPRVHARGAGALTALTDLGCRDLPDLAVEHTDEMVRQVDEQLLNTGRVKEGDLVVIIAGSPPGIPGSTNALRIHRMGDAINEVAPAYRSRG